MIGYINHLKIGITPSEWKVSKLSDVVELIHGYQFRTEDFTDEGLAVVKIGNVIGNNLNIDNLTFIESSRIEEFSQYVINEGDILMSLTGNIGRVIEVGSLQRKFLQNYRVGKFEPLNTSELSRKYVKFLLSSPLVLNQFYKFSNQSAQANFGKQDMDKVWVTIPKSMNEQQKIAEILSTVDDKIDVIDQQISETQELKKGLMQRLLTKGIGHTEFKDSPLGEIPESWMVRKLGQITSFSQGVQVDLSLQKNEPYEGSVRFLRIENYTQKSQDFRFIDKHLSKGKVVGKDDVIVVRYGATAGRIGRGIKGVLANNMFQVKPSVLVEKGFLFIFLNSLYDYLQRLMSGGAMPALNFGMLNGIDMPIPPSQEQIKITEILSSVDDKLEVLQDKKTHYQELKQGLMQQLLTGKIRVNGLAN